MFDLNEYKKSREEALKVQDNIVMDNYINKNTNSVTEELKDNNIKYLILGTGDKIINQYPKENSNINSSDMVILLTNNYTKTMPNLVGLSFKEVVTVLDFLDISYEYEGYGYLDSQSIEENTLVTNEKVKLIFKPKY